MEAVNPAWVPPKPGAVKAVCAALKVMDQAARAYPHNRDLAMRLTDEATGLIGHDAVLTIIELQNAGKLPDCATPAWAQFMDMAAAGDVEIATVIFIRDRGCVCADRVARRVRGDAPASAAEPVSLAAELKNMGLM